MPDITMCQNDSCPSAKKCYRHEAQPKHFMQSYAAFVPLDALGKCDAFMPICGELPPKPQQEQA